MGASIIFCHSKLGLLTIDFFFLSQFYPKCFQLLKLAWNICFPKLFQITLSTQTNFNILHINIIDIVASIIY